MDDSPHESETAHEVDLRDPLLAAFLALLWPGLGHFYQRRTAKAILFMVCIVGTYFYGWHLGGGKVVYASWRSGDRRWPYLCQVWVGLPAWPAMLQTSADRPFGKDFMRPPNLARQPPVSGPNELDLWHKEYHGNFELGTVFTMIAGLLNVLVIFDAAAGPVGSSPAEADKKEPDDKDGDATSRGPPADEQAEQTADTTPG